MEYLFVCGLCVWGCTAMGCLECDLGVQHLAQVDGHGAVC